MSKRFSKPDPCQFHTSQDIQVVSLLRNLIQQSRVGFGRSEVADYRWRSFQTHNMMYFSLCPDSLAWIQLSLIILSPNFDRHGQ